MGQTLILVNKFDIAWELLEKRSSKYSTRAKAPFAIELYVLPFPFLTGPLRPLNRLANPLN